MSAPPVQVTYNAPNRAHHYQYAAALARHGALRCFVSAFSRFSPRAALPEVGDKLHRADQLQNIYLASLRLRCPAQVSEELAFWSKCWLDRASEKPARASDLFLFYNGAGLRTTRRLAGTGVRRVVEAVNSHVLVQEAIMREEHRRLGLPFRPFHPREVARRVEEYHEADAILCPSAFVRRSFEEQGIASARIHVVPYGFSPPSAAGAPSPRDNQLFRVLYVGQISVRKGLRYLLEAFSALRHPRKELLLVGPMTSQTGIEDRALPEGARFAGVLKGEALAEAYRSATVFVLPTVEDGFGLVLGEALSFGVPLIATVNSGGSDLFHDSREGFLVPIRDPRAIADRLQQLADDPALLASMSAAALLHARTLQGWESTGKLLVTTLAAIAQTS